MFEDFLRRSSEFIAKKPGLVVSITFVVVVIFLILASTVEFTSIEYENYFPSGDVVYSRLELYQKDFGVRAENIFIMIKGDSIVSREVYEYMLKLGENLKRLKGVGEVTSPASIVAEIYGGIPEDENVLKALTERYASQLIPKPTLALMSISLTTTETSELAEQIERVVEFTHKPVGISVDVTGTPVLGYQILEATKRDTAITTNASIVAMILILLLTFSGVVRRKITTFMPLIISVFSVVIVVGLFPVFNLKLDMDLASTLPILIGLAIEYAAQIQNRYEEERRDGKSRDDAVVLSITRTGLAVVLAMLTTIIGFMSMTTTLIPELALFGIVMSVGLIIAYILSITFLPASLKLTDKEVTLNPNSKSKSEKVGLIERVLTVISGFTASNPRKILAVALVVIVFGAYANTQIKLETDIKKYFPENLPAMVRFKELERVIGKQYIYTVVLNFDEIDAETLKVVDELSKYIVSKEDMVYDYDSLSTLLKTFTGRIPQSDTELLSVMDTISEENLKRYISGDKIAVYFYTTADTQDKRLELWDYLKRDIQFFGLHDYYVTGMPIVMAHLGEVMINSQFLMTAVAYSLIVLLLFGIHRSITRALVPLVAITTVIGILNITMFVFGIKQTMMSIAINAIVLGLGIDFSIHITERYFEERLRFSPFDSVRRTIERTGKAVLTSALTMAGGFGALILSSFPMLRDFGFLSFVAIVFSLMGALTVVPAFLMFAERFKGLRLWSCLDIPKR